jgi:hypothetical protein
VRALDRRLNFGNKFQFSSELIHPPSVASMKRRTGQQQMERRQAKVGTKWPGKERQKPAMVRQSAGSGKPCRDS